MKHLLKLTALAVLITTFASCKKESVAPGNAKLIIKFKFDSTQIRLNNIGQPSTVPAGHAAQHPVFSKMSAHYIEFATNALTPLGKGAVLYRAEETMAGGANAINFEKALLAGNDEIFFTIPVSAIPPGTYEWLRISLAYQNADVKFKIDTTINGITINKEFTGTLAGFIGFNTYIKNFKIKNESLTVNSNRKQGYWGFETLMTVQGFNIPFTTSGQAPEGATTVVNPIFATSPIPAGSCVVTAAFVPGKLRITGNESTNIVIEASFSTNKSFEWEEVVFDGKWEPGKGERVVDMGIRGMVPMIR